MNLDLLSTYLEEQQISESEAIGILRANLDSFREATGRNMKRLGWFRIPFMDEADFFPAVIAHLSIHNRKLTEGGHMVEYLAEHPSFDPVAKDATVPQYRLQIDRVPNGETDCLFVRI
jgi:hypothetical protein